MQHHNFNLLVREHTYRPALKMLLEAMLPSLTVLNDSARWGDCGAPDFILVRRNDFIPVAFAETKDLNDPDLAGRNKKNKEQFDRYKQSLGNIIFTDYLDFRFYENGEATEIYRFKFLYIIRLTFFYIPNVPQITLTLLDGSEKILKIQACKLIAVKFGIGI
jgi:hypothetical protein